MPSFKVQYVTKTQVSTNPNRYANRPISAEKLPIGFAAEVRQNLSPGDSTYGAQAPYTIKDRATTPDPVTGSPQYNWVFQKWLVSGGLGGDVTKFRTMNEDWISAPTVTVSSSDIAAFAMYFHGGGPSQDTASIMVEAVDMDAVPDSEDYFITDKFNLFDWDTDSPNVVDPKSLLESSSEGMLKISNDVSVLNPNGTGGPFSVTVIAPKMWVTEEKPTPTRPGYIKSWFFDHWEVLGDTDPSSITYKFNSVTVPQGLPPLLTAAYRTSLAILPPAQVEPEIWRQIGPIEDVLRHLASGLQKGQRVEVFKNERDEFMVQISIPGAEKEND